MLAPALLGALLIAHGATAQKVKLISGDLSSLKSQSSIAVMFTYDSMMVGKDKEADYVKTKREEYNKKEPGKGDTWAKAWVSDRTTRYEPRFNEMFTKEWGGTIDAKAKYTLIMKSMYIEPGFNVGVAHHNAELSGEVWIVDSGNPSNVIAKIMVTNAPGRLFFGADFDTGVRIEECYATASRAVAKFLRKS